METQSSANLASAPQRRPTANRGSRPILIRRGAVTVRIHSSANRVKGRTYSQHCVIYRQVDGKTVRRNFGSLDEAKREADIAATRLATGLAGVLQAGNGELFRLQEADLLAQKAGVPLLTALSDYSTAKALLPAGTTLAEAAADYARRKQAVREVIQFPDLVTEYLGIKAKAGMSKRHLADLRRRLNRAAKSFACPVGSITTPLIESFLDQVGGSSRSRLNEIVVLSAVLRYAVKQRKAPRETLDELEAVQRPKVPPPATLVWTVEEFRELLELAPSHHVPYLVLGGLCGMRSSEILRCDWSHFTATFDHVAVVTMKRRTPARRLVPVCPAAQAWLEPLRKKTGPVFGATREQYAIRAILRSVNAARKATGKETSVLWKGNGLRHSFGTYKTALSGDIPRTAIEMGNSPTMIVKCYLQLATKAEGERFFSIRPSIPGSKVS